MKYPNSHREDGIESGRAAATKFESMSAVGRAAWARAFAEQLSLRESDDSLEREMVIQQLSMLVAALAAQLVEVADDLP